MKDFKCELCQKTFKCKYNLQRHKKICKGVPEEQPSTSSSTSSGFKCDICFRPFTRKHSLNRHKKKTCKLRTEEKVGDITVKESDKKVKKDNQQNWKCDMCKSTVGDIENIPSHNANDHEEVTNSEKCNSCKTFNLKEPCSKHVLNQTKSDLNLCDKCGVAFSKKSGLLYHKKKHCHPYHCKSCHKAFPTEEKKDYHEKYICPKREDKRKKYLCSKCMLSFDSNWDYLQHRSEKHRSREFNKSSKHGEVDGEEVPWLDENGRVDEQLKAIYQRYDHIINRTHRIGNFMNEYNYRLSDESTYEDLDNHVREVYKSMDNSFRINLSFGFILKSIEDGMYRYFYPHNNDGVLDAPFSITNGDDVLKFIQRLRNIDILKHLFNQRPNTKWKVYKVTNVRYCIFKLLDKKLGAGLVPEYIRRRKCIISLDIDRSKRKAFSDNLCAFRCLAYHRGHREPRESENVVRVYRNKWCRFKRLTNENFTGISLKEMFDFEQVFQVNVNLFSLKENGDIESVYRSSFRYKDTMYANVYKNHMSYITNIKLYSKCFKCRTCQKVFSTFYGCKRHESTCTKATKLFFPGKYYKPEPDLFEKLENIGIVVAQEERFYPYFIVYDFEAYLEKVNTDCTANESNTFFSHEHVPISVSICSNVQGYTQPHCIVEQGEELLEYMYDYMKDIQQFTSKELTKKYDVVFQSLRDILYEIDIAIEAYKQDDDDVFIDSNEAMETNEVEAPSYEFIQALNKPNTYISYLENLENISNSSDRDSSEEMIVSEDYEDSQSELNSQSFIEVQSRFWLELDGVNDKVLECLKKTYVKLLNELTRFCNVVPVLGFNSSKYDLNLIKRKLFKLMDVYVNTASVIKKGNSYLCIQTDLFRFLDISNYLAPGFSYSQFLKAYEVNITKSFMCYEWLDSVSKLDYPCLPGIECFYSSVKKCNVLEEEYLAYENSKDKSKLSPPKTAEENYAMLQEEWRKHNMKTFRDFLIYYNNLDTYPFVQAVQKLLDFYHSINIEPFTQIVSLPGIARKLLFNNIDHENIFALFDRKTEELYSLFDNNIVGGPSIVFCRYHETDKTSIRSHIYKEEARLCKIIKGFDCNR